MSSAGVTSSAALDNKKVTKFVELLVHDYLQNKGFHATGEKFAEECSKGATEDAAAINSSDGDGVDEAGSWYCLSDKLALPELLRHNAMAALGQRFASVMEVLIQEMVREKDGKTSAPSSVSIASVRDSKGRRRPMVDQNATTRSMTTASGLGSTGSEVSTVTASKGSQESLLTGRGGGGGGGVSSTGVLPGGRGGCSNMNETVVGGVKERCKTSPLQGKMGASRGNLGCRIEGREATRKHHASSTKRGHGLSSPPKGGRGPRDTGGMLNKFQFSKDALRRHQMSHESWIPEDLRMKMMRRSMAVIKENVYESVAQRSLVRKEKKRSSRSELEIVKTQEKFGTKHQRPCALCEQSFSEVNLVLAVPFKVYLEEPCPTLIKAIVDLRIAWQKTLPQATGSTTKTNRTMLMPPQCYNEVKVCAFCSQLFHDPLGYRPTWDMEVLRMRKKKDQLALEKEREYWDPLRNSSLNMATQSKGQEQQLSPAEAAALLSVEAAA